MPTKNNELYIHVMGFDIDLVVPSNDDTVIMHVNSTPVHKFNMSLTSKTKPEWVETICRTLFAYGYTTSSIEKDLPEAIEATITALKLLDIRLTPYTLSCILGVSELAKKHGDQLDVGHISKVRAKAEKEWGLTDTKSQIVKTVCMFGDTELSLVESTDKSNPLNVTMSINGNIQGQIHGMHITSKPMKWWYEQALLQNSTVS